MSRWIVAIAVLSALACSRKAAQNDEAQPTSVDTPASSDSAPTSLDDTQAVRKVYDRVAKAMTDFDGRAMDALVHPKDRTMFRAISLVQAVHAMTGTVEFLAQQSPEASSKVNAALIELLRIVELDESSPELLSLDVAKSAATVEPKMEHVGTEVIYRAMKLAFDEAEAVLGNLPSAYGAFVDAKITGDKAVVSYQTRPDMPTCPLAAVRVDGTWYYDALGTIAALDARMANQ
jgi:hypothetical protein